MPVEVAINLTYALYSVLFAGAAFEWQKLLDPWGIFGIAGRPHDQATEQVINRLLGSTNAASRLWAIELTRGLNQFGLTISTSGSGRSILDAWFSQFVTNMVAQGVPKLRAQEIGIFAMSPSAQAGAPLEPELQTPLSPSLTFNGPQSLADEFLKGIKFWNAQGAVGGSLFDHAQNWLLNHATVTDLTALRIGQPIQGNPTLPTLTTGIYANSGTCQPGYNYDATTELCWPIPLTPPPLCPPGMHFDFVQAKCVPDQTTPPPPTGGGGGTTTTPDPDGDEITDDLCAQIGQAASAIINALGGSGGTTNPIDAACCQNIVDAIAGVASALTAILSAFPTLTTGAGNPVDLTAVVDALNSLVAAVGSISGATPVDLSGVVAALDNIAAKIPASTGTDVSGIVDQLKQIVGQGDVDQPILDAMQAAGLISPSDLQTLQGLKWSDAISYITGSTPIRTVEGLIKHVGADVNAVKAYLASRSGPGADWIVNAFGGSISTTANALQPPIETIIRAVVGTLRPTAQPTVGNVNVNADRVVADVAAVLLNMKVLATIVGLLREGAAEGLYDISEKVIGLLGFEELREVQIGPLVREGIAKKAEMDARALFAQEIPGSSAIGSWVARGLFDKGKAAQWMLYNGTGPEAFGPTLDASYTGLQARMMIRAFDSGLFSLGDIADELTFRGMRPASQKRMLLLAPWLATVSERNQLRATLEKAYIDGLFDDANFTQQIDALNQNTNRDALIMARVQLEKRIAFTKELETAYRQEFTIGLILEPQYRGFLAGIGLQTDFINARLAADQAHMAATTYRKELAAELALERTTAAEERRAAVKNFTSGNIDAAALTAALLLTGLNPAQAAAWVDLAVLQKAGNLRWTFGLQLPPAESALLHSRVTALSDQRKRLQITEPAFVAALQALGIPEHFRNSINAQVNAMISPKTAAVTLPVETS